MMKADKHENYGQDDKNFQNTDPGKQLQKASLSSANPIADNTEPADADDLSTSEISNPYDSENLDNESDSESKDITEKDIEEDLIENDPSEGFETDIGTAGNKERENGAFQTIEPDLDNPINREFEIEQLGNEELKEDEIIRNATGNGAPGRNKPSQRKF